jgi:hypothetical protein
MGAQVVTVNDVLDGHMALDIQCLDRVYLNAYVPRLQTSAQVVAFLSGHLGYPFPSPALFNQIGQRFRRAVAAYAQANDLPWVQFGKDDKLAVMGAHLDRQAATGTSGVAAIGVAQEFQRVWTATKGKTTTGTPRWSFSKADRRVTCSYLLPVGRRLRPRLGQGVCLVPVSGQDLAQRPRVGQTPSHQGWHRLYRALQRLRHLPGSTSPAGHLRPARSRHHRRVHSALAGSAALPLTDTDRDPGYWWEISMRQVEVSRTIVFDAPRHARGFFEALIADNLDLGRPHNVEIIFGRRVRRDTIGTFRTAIDRRDNSRRAHQGVLPPLSQQAIPQRRPRHGYRNRL